MFTKGKITRGGRFRTQSAGIFLFQKERKKVYKLFFFILFSPHDIEFFREMRNAKKEREIFFATISSPLKVEN